MADSTRTLLNAPTVAGGDEMDETAVLQPQDPGTDSLSASRARVDVGFQSFDDMGRLVGKKHPLPVEDDEGLKLLKQIAEDIRAIRILLAATIND